MVKSGLEKEDPMNMQRRFGVLTAIAGAALALGSLTLGGSATAGESSNNDEHPNITTCPAGTTQFDGQEESGSGSEVLFHWAVTDDTYVTITQIDPTVTGLTAYIKGGDDYSTYSPVIAGVRMQSPDNGGGNVPELSHWMLCYTITPLETTTTATTIPVVPGPNYIETSYTVACGTTTITLHNVSPWIYPVSVYVDGATTPSYGPTVDNRTDGGLSGPQKDATKSRTITFPEDSGAHTVSFVVNAGSENDLYMNLPVGTMTTYSVGSDCIPPETTTTTIPAPVYSYNLTSMCRPSETEGSLRIRNGSPTDQAYTLALYGGAMLSGIAAPGDTLVTVPWSSGGDTWILTIDGRNITKAIGNNPACEVPPTTTLPPTTTTTVPEIVTTTTIGESGGPTTTAAATTTTEQASEGPTTTALADEGGGLPATGGGSSLQLVLGLAMLAGGVLFTLLGRSPHES